MPRLFCKGAFLHVRYFDIRRMLFMGGSFRGVHHFRETLLNNTTTDTV